MEEINVILHGKLVNVGRWAASHPGGKEILKAFHERDATEQFEAMHSPEARRQLFSSFLPKSPSLSSLSSSPSPSSLSSSGRSATSFSASSIWASPGSAIMDNDAPFLKSMENEISKDFIELRKKLEEKGMFKTNILKEFLMAFYTFSMYLLGGYVIFFTPYGYKGMFLLLLGLHQSGWVAHDYLHHSIFPSVYWNEVVGDILGTLQGYDRGWWKSRHNAHHVNTNECLHDPDISIAPLFHFVQQYPDLKTRLKHIQKYQQYYFIPFLTLLDVDWRFESILYSKNVFQKDKLPAFKLLVHYIVGGAITYIVGIKAVILLTLTRGFCTAIIVFSNHYAEKRFNSAPSLSLAEQTAYTTRNIGGGFLMDFLSGHISLQIEHHLFPTMPPHNLTLARPFVKQFFKKHNLPYHESSLLECTTMLLRSLDMHA